MSEWLFADSDMPNWFMCFVFAMLLFAMWALHDATKLLRESTAKWTSVADLYDKWVDEIETLESRK